jgi:hypothetical protein
MAASEHPYDGPARALALYERWRRERAAGGAPSIGELLASHPTLRHILEPLLTLHDAPGGDAPPVETVGPFKILGNLGEGGKGTV